MQTREITPLQNPDNTDGADLSKWKERLVLLLFPILIWASRYIYTPQFGVYEDDYSRIPPAVEMNPVELGQKIIGFITQYVGQGRPLQLTFTFLQAHLGWSIGGLDGVYVFGFGVLTVNAILFYFLVRRLTNFPFAIVATTLFCIYSADTNQAYLTRSLGVFPAITFLLLSMHAYVSGRRFLTYISAFAILITYETPYPVLFAMPLLELQHKWDRTFIKRFLINSLALAAILLAVFGARYLLGESRVLGLSITDALMTAVRNPLIGTAVNLGLFFYRPIQALQQPNPAVVLVSLSALLLIAVVFSRLDFNRPVIRLDLDQKKPVASPRDNAGRTAGQLLGDIRELVRRHSNLLILGLVMLALAYPLTLTVRPYAISGRTTRVHFAGQLGSSFFWSTVLYITNMISARLRREYLGTAITAVVLSLTLGFGVVVQQDYARAWELQRTFWRSLSETIPYTEESLTVLVDPQGLQDTRYIDANTWSLPSVYQFIYAFPNEEIQGPQIHRLIPDWKEHLQVNSVEIKTLNYRYQLVTSSWEDTIILETENNRISNRLTSIEIGDKEFLLSQLEFEAQPDFRAGVLYSELLE